MSRSNHAQFRCKQAYLSGEFGESMARRYFGDELVDAMPRYVRGKRKGLLKGQIVWRKVERGGFVITARCRDALTIQFLAVIFVQANDFGFCATEINA